MTAAAVADCTAREFLRNADPVLARVIDAHPDFRPRAWIDELPGLDAFGTLIFQVAGQQLSVRATRAILSRLEQSFGGHLPSPAKVLAADPEVLRASGLSTRKGSTLRSLAERFVDGRLSDDALTQMTDDEIETALTEVSGHAVERLYGLDHLPTQVEMEEVAERWRPYRSLAVSYLFASEFEERRS
jgi:DNA-3-methyladenine glycosylase II